MTTLARKAANRAADAPTAPTQPGLADTPLSAARVVIVWSVLGVAAWSVIIGTAWMLAWLLAWLPE